MCLVPEGPHLGGFQTSTSTYLPFIGFQLYLLDSETKLGEHPFHGQIDSAQVGL